jgi:hypothetical protein
LRRIAWRSRNRADVPRKERRWTWPSSCSE